MDYLSEFLERSEVQDAVGACRASRAVQGVAVELDSFWLSAWRAAARENPIDPREAPGPQRGFGWVFEGGIPVETAGATMYAPHLAPTGPLKSEDLSWEPPTWSSRVRPNAGEPENPIQLHIYLYPEYWRNAEASLPQLSELPINYVFESSPVPRLAARVNKFDPLIGGVSIGVNATKYGTLGGLLRANDDRHYGITCAHVVSNSSTVYHPSQRDSKVAHAIGRVAHVQLPKAYPDNLPITQANQAANSNDMDVALIEIDVDADLAVDTLGPISGIFPRDDIQQWHPTIFVGRTSGVRNVEFLARLLYYNIPTADGNGTNCFNDILQVQWPPGGGSNGKPPLQEGDSGAWLCIGGPNGWEWAAMVIGWAPQIGYAVPASNIAKWWQQLGLDLSPLK